MIAKLSRQITAFLIREKSISAEDAEIYQYGVEITISTVLNIALILLVSILARNVVSGIIFLGVFVILRQFSGGYHATSYFRCNAVLVITYGAVLLLSRYVIVSFWVNCIFILLGMIVIVAFAPVPNANKPLSKAECKMHKCNSSVAYIILSIAGVLISEKFHYYSRVLLFTLMSIVILIIVEILMQRSGLHESKKADC